MSLSAARHTPQLWTEGEGHTPSPAVPEISSTAEQRPTSRPDTLVRMRKGDPSELPVFMCHDASGDVNSSVRLARLLPGRRPVLGIKARSDADGAPADLIVEDMAQAAVAVMRTVQPTGPYTLVGYSFGALVAYETARLLRQAGHEVAHVVLLDPYFGVQCLSRPNRWWYLAVGRVWSVLRWLPRVDHEERSRFLRKAVRALLPWTSSVLVHINDGTPSKKTEAFAETAVMAMNAYRPGRLDAPVRVVHCTLKFPCRCNPIPILTKVLDPSQTTMHVMEGSHFEMVADPGVATTSALIGEVLDDDVALAR